MFQFDAGGGDRVLTFGHKRGWVVSTTFSKTLSTQVLTVVVLRAVNNADPIHRTRITDFCAKSTPDSETIRQPKLGLRRRQSRCAGLRADTSPRGSVLATWSY